MKIAVIISRPEMGGAQRVSINLVRWINENTTHQASIVALSHMTSGAYDMAGCNYHYLSTSYKSVELRKYIISQNFNIVLTMGVPLCVYTIPATFGLRVKHIVSERNDPSHFSGKKITAIISRSLMKYADGYVFQTNQARLFYGEKIRSKSVVIPNPLFNINNMPVARYTGERKKEIVSVGRLNPQKNHRLLIDAFNEIHKLYPNYKLIIWGEGAERPMLESYIRKLNLQDYVNLPGLTNKLFEEIYSSTLFVLSSDFEGLPNALIEAMALGLPVISTDCPCGGPAFLLQNMKNGILVEVGNKMSLVNAIEYMLNNPKEAGQMGEKAFSVRDELSVNNINQRWIEYFKNILA